MNSIILVGIKHCGKSTQGRLLSGQLGLPFFDTDKVLEEQTGCTARQLYAERGVEAFKAAETEACRFIADTLSPSSSDAVIATGGGICTNEAALDLLRPLGTFVFLIASERIAANRIVQEARMEDGKLVNLPAYIAKKNPQSLEEVRAFFHEFYVEREKQYASLANVSIRMGNAPKQVNARRILALLRRS